ncbi:MAG: DUF1080 domain-containing protein [Planctomycetota bacterium]|nr:DUF1080 domain-containing protein [Planctomycetota bacterium]
MTLTPLLLALAASAAPLGAQSPETLGSPPHRYAWEAGWLKTPDGGELGNTHGVIIEDSAGLLYLNTDTERAISVYGRDGKLVRSFGAEEGEGVHGMCIVKEKDGEFLYHVNFRLHHWKKRKLDGTLVWERGVPLESGKYEKPDQFKPTSIAVVPDGSIFVADGYGTSWVHQYDHEGKYVKSFGGPGAMNCCHGLLVDTRREPHTLLVADRENSRLLRYDLQGNLLSEIQGMFRRPCSIQQHDGYLAVPDLAGRVTILGPDDQLVVHLGDQPDESKRARNDVPKAEWRDGIFLSPHSAHWDREGNLYVMDWNFLGRVNKLRRLLPPLQKDGVGYDDTPFLPGSDWRVHDKNRPPAEVMVGSGGSLLAPPPKGAIVLFDGKDLSQWRGGDKPAAWAVKDGYAEVNGTGNIETKEKFGDFQLHLEFATPTPPKGDSQGRGNSGVFLMGRYEIQVLDSYQNRTYADGQCAAMYGQQPPLYNASAPPGEWQSYDITFRAPRFDGAKLVSPATVTVVHNGVVVHANQAFLGATQHRAVATYSPHEPELPLALQDHGDPVRYRNIWIRKL